MALSFTCQNCGAEIVTKYLKVGEMARCFSCGAQTKVPEGATSTDKEPSLSRVTETTVDAVKEEDMVNVNYSVSPATQPAWNPKGLGWFTFFFSFIPTGVIYAINWDRLGRPELRSRWLIALGPLAIAYLVLAYVTPDTHQMRYLFGAINAGFAYFVYKNQGPYFKKFLKAGGRQASYWLPAMNSALCVVILVGILFAVAVFETTQLTEKYNTAYSYFEDGRYADAKPILVDLLNDAEDDPEVHYLLAVIYYDDLSLDSAYNHALRAVDLDFSGPGAKRLVTHMVEVDSLIPSDSGMVRTWFATGERKAEREYHNRVWHGVSTEWFSNGSLRSRQTFTNGELDGPIEFWYDNGQRLGMGNYHNGKRHGLFRNWSETGAIESEEQYEDGHLVG